jgi:Domain of Unknown Function (DUF748)
VKLEGVLGDSAKLVLTGWFTPFTDKPYMQLQATIRSYDLPPLNPYATEYVSHRIRQGQITTEVNYMLKGNEIEATAEIVLRNVRVGEKTSDDFANRIGIPLELAIALLKDIQGVIRLQVAMSGDTGPQLNIGSLIWNAVRNAIVRAITAPFRLVGKILTFGGRIGGIDIEPILFQPGTREIAPQSSKQLSGVAELLREKPEIELKLNGRVSEDEVDALKKKTLWQKIQAAEGKNYEEALIRVYREMGGITKPTAPLDPVAEQSLERFVMERIAVGEEDLRQLARDRAEIVKDELASRGVNPERLVASAGEVLTKDKPAAVEVELIA